MEERNITNIASELNVIKSHIKYYENLEYKNGYNVYLSGSVRYPFSGLGEEDFCQIKNKIIEMLKECFNKKINEMIKFCEENKEQIWNFRFDWMWKNMKLGDVYRHKENNSIIQIDSFAARMGKIGYGDSIIVFRQIVKHNEFEIGSCPSFNGYGTQEEIEKDYELLVPQDKLNEYQDWNEIFELLDRVNKSKVLMEGV